MRSIVFNVGGALATYFEQGETYVVVDIGKSNEFSPVNDFLLPLFEKKKRRKNHDGKYVISQLVVSHPHNDHLSDIQPFDKSFCPYLLTCPNNNTKGNSLENIRWNRVSSPQDPNIIYLKKMMKNRCIPLRSVDPQHIYITYIKPGNVERNKSLLDESYTNNISIVTFIDFGIYSIFLPGDLQKEGMKYLLSDTYCNSLKKKLGQGVDYLICPHHGLRSSFSVDLFSSMKDGKTQRLNIVSEKRTSEGNDRIVDSRYGSAQYCLGKNNLSKENDVFQRKTSGGHIFIGDDGNIIISNDINYLISLF